MTAKTFTTTDGADLAYDDNGTGQPVVLIHGLGSQRAHWIAQQEALLSAGYRVIALDLRFHGASARTTNGARVSRLGRDIGELIEHEDLRDIVLIGHSMGVSANFAYLSLHGPGRVAKLVIVDQSPRILNDHQWSNGVRGVTWDQLEDQLAGRQPWGAWDREPKPPAHVLSMLTSHPFEDLFHGAHAALVADHFVADWRDEVSVIAVPVWVATGAYGPVYPREAMQWLVDTLPIAYLTVFDNSGHTPHWNEPDAFNEELLRFLRG